jgi:hypothetical protein
MGYEAVEYPPTTGERVAGGRKAGRTRAFLTAALEQSMRTEMDAALDEVFERHFQQAPGRELVDQEVARCD